MVDDGSPRPVVEWHVRRKWLVSAVAGCSAWAAAWIGGFAAVGALDRAFSFGYFILMPFLFTVAAVWGRRIRLTPSGIEYVGGLSRLTIDWSDVESVDRRHLVYTLARETTTDTGLKISMDSFVRASPRKYRRVPVRPFLDDERYMVLRQRLQEHRPDLVLG